MLQLICAVVDAEAVLVVDICRHQVVAELQEKVATMLTSSEELDFQKLDLYLAKQDGKPGKAWLPFNDELAQLQQGDVPKYITTTYMRKELLLDPRSQLSDHFSDAPEAGVVHVLLTTPFCVKYMRKLYLAFKLRPNCDDDLAKVVTRQCYERNLHLFISESCGRYGWEFECYESDEDDELVHHQQVALSNDIRARAAKGKCILGPAWLFDTYVIDPRNTFVRATMVYIAPKRKAKVVPRPQKVEPCRWPSLGQWLHSVLRWPPHDGQESQETDGSCDDGDSMCGAVGIEMRSFNK